MPKTKMSRRRSTNARKLYETNQYTVAQLARRYKVSVSCMSRVLSNKTQIDKDYLPAPSNRDRVASLYRQGKSIHEIGRIVGISEDCVRHYYLGLWTTDKPKQLTAKQEMERQQ